MQLKDITTPIYALGCALYYFHLSNWNIKNIRRVMRAQEHANWVAETIAKTTRKNSYGKIGLEALKTLIDAVVGLVIVAIFMVLYAALVFILFETALINLGVNLGLMFACIDFLAKTALTPMLIQGCVGTTLLAAKIFTGSTALVSILLGIVAIVNKCLNFLKDVDRIITETQTLNQQNESVYQEYEEDLSILDDNTLPEDELSESIQRLKESRAHNSPVEVEETSARSEEELNREPLSTQGLENGNVVQPLPRGSFLSFSQNSAANQQQPGFNASQQRPS